jgi:hypothetical protein
MKSRSLLLASSLLASSSLFGQAALTFYDLAPTDAGGGLYTSSVNLASAPGARTWGLLAVVSNDNSSTALTASNASITDGITTVDLTGSSVVNYNDGSRNVGIAFFYADISSLTAGAQDIEFMGTLGSNRNDLYFYQVDDTLGVNDIAFNGALDDDNPPVTGSGGAAGTFGFNGANTYTTSTLTDEGLSFATGDAAIVVLSGGAAFGTYSAGTGLTEDASLAQSSASTFAGSTIATADDEALGVDFARGPQTFEGFYRTVAGGISFTQVPEPSSAALGAGLALGLAIFRRRKA